MIIYLIFLEFHHHSSCAKISRESPASVRRVKEPFYALSASGARPSRPTSSIGRGDSSCNQGWRQVQHSRVRGCAAIRAGRGRRGGAAITGRRVGREQWRREAANKVERGRQFMDRRPRRWKSHDMSCQGEEEPSRKKDMHSYKKKSSTRIPNAISQKKADRQVQYSISFEARGTELQRDLCIHALHEPCTSCAMV